MCWDLNIVILSGAWCVLTYNDTIVALPADKSNVTVVIHREEYNSKIESMLSDKTYKKLKRDPTLSIVRRIGQVLKHTKSLGYITKEKRLYITPKSTAPPQHYGLPKIHKDNIPLTPIVSAINSPTYQLSKELARILTPTLGNLSPISKTLLILLKVSKKPHGRRVILWSVSMW